MKFQWRYFGVLCLPRGSPFLVLDPNLRQTFAALVEIANFDQRWPQLDRAFDHADDVIHDPQQILLKKVRLESIERLLQVCGEELKRLGPRRVLFASPRPAARADGVP